MKTKISEWSTTPASNTDIDGINIAEGCAPSGINDAIRDLMAQVRSWQSGASGDPFNGPMNGTIGATTAYSGAFTTVSATGVITSTLATGTAPLTIASTTKVTNLNADLLDGADWASPAALGSTTPAAVSATTLSASGTVSGTGFSNYLASPPAIGGTTAAAGSFTTLTTSSTVTLNGGTANGVTYLNGSKVLTSGSALTFDGSTFGTTGNMLVPIAKSYYCYTTDYGMGTPDSLGLQLFYAAGDVMRFGSRSAGTFSEQMRLTSTGLGIGTSSPAFKLDVAGTIQSTVDVRIKKTGSDTFASGPFLYLNSGDGSGNGSALQLNASNGLDFWNSSGGTWTRRATLDSAGNLGLGVTPSATWFTGSKVFQIGTTGALWNNGSNQTALSHNAVFNNSDARYLFTEEASYYSQLDGQHRWFTAPSGTAGNAISFTQAMTLDASGNLGVGTTSPTDSASFGRALDVAGGASTGAAIYVRAAASATNYLALGQDTSGNSYIINRANSSMLFYTNNTERARIDSSGNLLIGRTTTPADNFARIAVSNTTDTAIQITKAGVIAARLTAVSTGLAFGVDGSDGATERARIDSSGNLLIGTTSQTQSAKLTVDGAIAGSGYQSHAGSSGAYQSNVFNFNWTGSPALWVDTTNLGNIQLSSDYRIKKNIETQVESGIERVMQLRPVVYELADYGDLFKSDGIQREGFIAHEVQEVIPSGAEGQKDEEGRIQNLRVDAILAVAVKAIQEQQAIIESLKARLDAANL